MLDRNIVPCPRNGRGIDWTRYESELSQLRPLGDHCSLLLIALFNLFQSPGQRSNSREVSYSQFIDDVSNGRVKSVTITGQRITGTFADNGSTFQTYSPGDTGLVSRLEDKGVSRSPHARKPTVPAR